MITIQKIRIGNKVYTKNIGDDNEFYDEKEKVLTVSELFKKNASEEYEILEILDTVSKEVLKSGVSFKFTDQRIGIVYKMKSQTIKGGVVNVLYMDSVEQLPIHTDSGATIVSKGFTLYKFEQNPEFFNTLEKKIINEYPRTIRLEKTLRNRKESPEDFLLKFLSEWNDEKNTIYVDDNEIQTEKGKRRSLGDIFMIVKYYYPQYTLRDLINFLYVVMPKKMNYKLAICAQIKKRVWVKNDTINIRHSENKDEYGFTEKNYTEQL